MTSPNEARFLLVKMPIQNDKGIHEEWIIAEALQMENVFGLASHAVVNKPLSSFHLFTPTYQRILCTITNMNSLVMCSTESTAQVPASVEIPTVPLDSIYYSSDSSGNEYSSSASGSSYLRTPLSSSPASTFYHPNTVRDNNNTNNQLEIALINSLAQHQLPVSQKSLIMEGYHYIFLSNKTHYKILPMQVQVVDVDENQKMIVASPYQKVCSVIFNIGTGKILQSHDTEPVFVSKPANINNLLPEQSLHDLLTAQPPFRKKLIGKRHTGDQILLSTRTDGGIDPNLPQDNLLTTFTEITRWMVPLVVVTHNLIIVEYNTFFQDVFGFCSDWKKRPLTDFLKKDDRYGFVFTERNSNIQIPVRFEKLEPAFTVHNWHHGLAWYAIVPLNLPDCWVQYTPQIDDYVADTQLASDVFSGFSKLSENKVTVKLIQVASPIEFPLFQRLLELRHHPNIATIEGVFLRDHVAFVVTRTPGKPLSKILEAQIHVQHPDHAIAVLVRLVSALWFCHHEKRIAHGSLSFENVLVDDKWNPYLTGFGGRSTIDANAERFREDIRQLHSIFLALLSGMAKPPQEWTGSFMYHSAEIRDLVKLLHSPQCTLKDILSHPAVQNFVKNHNFKLTFY